MKKNIITKDRLLEAVWEGETVYLLGRVLTDGQVFGTGTDNAWLDLFVEFQHGGYGCLNIGNIQSCFYPIKPGDVLILKEDNGIIWLENTRGVRVDLYRPPFL